MPSSAPVTPIPIILLKTASTPSDAYADYLGDLRFRAPNVETQGLRGEGAELREHDVDGETGVTSASLSFQPLNLPVLEHRFHAENLARVETLLATGAFDGTTEMTEMTENDEAHREDAVGNHIRRKGNVHQDKRVEGNKYGGLIFTSQRAVEAFLPLLSRFPNTSSSPLRSTPLYVVGPATHRALVSSPCVDASNVHGAETGNGDALAKFILDHYNNNNKLEDNNAQSSESTQGNRNRPLLFLVGEQRRDIIPRTLMSPDLPAAERIPVEELVVYETGLMHSFAVELSRLLEGFEESKVVWLVVFSPTGCREMLSVLGLLDEETGRVREDGRSSSQGRGKVLVATIGPTTRDYLIKTFGFEPDALIGYGV